MKFNRQTVAVKPVFAVIMLSIIAYCQVPDSPTPQPKCGPWSCWSYPNVPTREVLRSKAFWATFGSDVGLTTMDVEVTHQGLAHGLCVERNIHPPHPSRGQLYRSQLPENASIAVVSFVWLKLKGPKLVMPGFLGRPGYVHISATDHWLKDCW